MEVLVKLTQELGSILIILASAVPYIAGYIGLILLTLFVWRLVKRVLTPKQDFSSLKTVTFGDESAVSSNFAASVVSIVLILVLWGSFTGSKILPSFMHVPGAFRGEAEFTYTAEKESGLRDDATVPHQSMKKSVGSNFSISSRVFPCGGCAVLINLLNKREMSFTQKALRNSTMSTM